MDGNDGQLEGQAFDGAGQLGEESGPQTLSDAFVALREDDSQGAGEAVQGADGAAEPSDAGSGEPGYDEDGEADDGVGGPSAGAEDLDDVDYRGSLSDEIGKAAVKSAALQFQQMNITKYTVNDLIQRDERNGTVTFVNPDDPRRPFSSRAEAQGWCESVNKDIDREFRKLANSERARLARQYKPAMDLLEFAPKFNRMGEEKRELLAELIDPYAVTDPKGNVIGYSCNLEKMSAQADKILGRFESRQAKRAKQQQASEPALDTPSGGSGSDQAAPPGEPRTLAEAMQRLNESRKG